MKNRTPAKDKGKMEKRIGGQSRVLVAKASYEAIDPVLNRILDSLDLRFWYDGLTGKTVFIKPNMIGLFPPEHHATTHPSIVHSLVKFFRQAGAEVTVGDNCGVGGYGLNQRVAEVTGIAGAASGTYKNVALDTALVKLNSKYMESIAVSRDMIEADVLINVPKMKTHSLTIVSGAVKNMFGVVAGAGKSQCHKSAAAVRDFGELLGDIYSVRPPDLTIMDGIVAMEGNGPTSGKPKPLGRILASTSAIALDAVMCRIMGILPDEIIHLRYLTQKGFGNIDPKSIEVIGEMPEISRFKLPVTIKRFGFLGWLVNKSFFQAIAKSRMVLEESLCKKCGICLAGCPTKAMEMDGFPRINEDKCIKCMCCHELCPESAWKSGRFLLRFQGRQL